FEHSGVYRVGNAAEMLAMIRKEGGLAWQAHPRTKSSTGYPDKTRDTEYFRDPTWLGAGFKAMPSDYSSPRLGERALKLLDDMNNWGLAKSLAGEVDVFKIDRTHELYGHMNINYLKLDRVPVGVEWPQVVRALQDRSSFVTTGEVLLNDWRLDVAAGEVSGVIDMSWTFPMNFWELVWGDGKETRRKIFPLDGTGQYGKQRIAFREETPGVTWARLAAWDTAANGAFTQPVRR
ncbi:MAG: hypothetical protein ACRD96_25125, partial [Bryobacteraceae bacterium]